MHPDLESTPLAPVQALRLMWSPPAFLLLVALCWTACVTVQAFQGASTYRGRGWGQSCVRQVDACSRGHHHDHHCFGSNPTRASTSPAEFILTVSCRAPPAVEGVCAFSQASLPGGSWAASCSDVDMFLPTCTLWATCTTPGWFSKSVRTGRDLKECMAAELGNDNGNLVINACRKCMMTLQCMMRLTGALMFCMALPACTHMHAGWFSDI